jgi:hypothetical protein
MFIIADIIFMFVCTMASWSRQQLKDCCSVIRRKKSVHMMTLKHVVSYTVCVLKLAYSCFSTLHEGEGCRLISAILNWRNYDEIECSVWRMNLN